MKYHINTNSEKPIYLQLYELLRNDITEGIYPLNAKLPSKRLLAEELGISVITVEHAYNLLCDEGYLEARERSGYFAVYRASDCFSVADSYKVRHYPKMKHIELDGTFPFSVLAKTMRRVLSDYGEALLIKCPNSGCPELRNAISQYLMRSRGITVSSKQIIIGAGAEYLYSLIIQMLGRNRIYAVEKPSYEKIELVYRANGVKCELLELGCYGIKSSELARSAASVLHITPYRSYPSGVTASASKRREYMHWADTGNNFIIEDDFESEFTLSSKPEETLFALSKKENVVYLNTFSKTIASSIRIGYMVLPEALIDLFNEKVGFYSCTVPLFEQYVIAEFINSGDFERHINRVRRKKRKLAEQQNRVNQDKPI